jgi:hypothetical protein
MFLFGLQGWQAVAGIVVKVNDPWLPARFQYLQRAF